MSDFYKTLKPLHLFIFATVFMLLARTIKNNFALEMACMLISLVLYILALVKLYKDKKSL
jgi:hypothetical protein